MYSDKRVRWKRDRIEKEIPGKRRKLEPSPGQRPLLRLESVWEEDLQEVLRLDCRPLCLAGTSHSHSLTDSSCLYHYRPVYILLSLSQSVGRILLSQPDIWKGCCPQAGAETRATTRRLHPPSLAFLVQAGLKHCSNQSTAANTSPHKHDHSRSLLPSSQLRSFSHSPFVSLGRVANLTARDTPLSSSLGPPVRVCHAHPYSLHQATPVQRISPTPTASKHP